MTIDDCVSSFVPEGSEPTKAGSQFWFVDRSPLGGRTVKMSIVNPGQATPAPHAHPEDEFFLDGEVRIAEAYASLYCPSHRVHGIRNVGTGLLKYLVIKTYRSAEA